MQTWAAGNWLSKRSAWRQAALLSSIQLDSFVFSYFFQYASPKPA